MAINSKNQSISVIPHHSSTDGHIFFSQAYSTSRPLVLRPRLAIGHLSLPVPTQSTCLLHPLCLYTSWHIGAMKMATSKFLDDEAR